MRISKFKFISNKPIFLFVSLFLAILFVTNAFASDPAISVIRTFDARSQEVIVGQQDVPLMGFLTGGSATDQTIKRFIIRFYADDDGSFDNNIGDQKASYFIASASLYDQTGALLSGPKPLRSFYAYDDVFFDSLEYKLAANTQKKFLVKVNLLSANPSEKAYLAAGLILSDVTAEEDSTFNASVVNGNDVNQEATKDPVVTVVKGGTMNIRAVPANPGTTTIPATSSILNTFWPTVEYRFSPTKEPFTLSKITVINDDDGEFDTPKPTCMIEKVRIDYLGQSGITGSFEAPLTNGSVTFSNLNYIIGIGSETGSLMVSAKFAQQSACTSSDKTLRLGLRSVNNNAGTFQATGNTSGTAIYNPSISASTSVNKLTIQYTEPVPVASAATLTLFNSTSIISKSYNAGVQNAGILAFSLQTDNQAHKLLRIITRFYGDDDGSFDNNIGDQKASRYIASASLYDDTGHLLSGPKVLRSYYNYDDVFFDSLNYTIPANTKKTFTIKINLNNTATEKAYLAVGVKADEENITAEDGNLFASEIAGSEINPGTSKSPVLTVSPTTVAPSAPASAPVQDTKTTAETFKDASGISYTLQKTESEVAYSDISFIDNQNGWAIGSSFYTDYSLIKTTNGGEKWTIIKLPSKDLYSIYFMNKNTGLAGGKSALIMKTTDGGSSWKIAPTITGDISISDIDCDSTGKICLAAGWDETILRSTDAGETWKKVNGNGTWSLSTVYFVSSKLVFASGGGILLKSTDSGSSWKKIQGLTETTGFSAIFCLDDVNCFAGGKQGEIARTYNGGEKWEKIATLYLNSNPELTMSTYGIHFFDKLNGWAVGGLSQGTLWRTKDGGKTWDHIQNKLITYNLPEFVSLVFIGNEAWIPSGKGTVLKIKDNFTVTASATPVASAPVETVKAEGNIDEIEEKLQLLQEQRAQLISELQKLESLINEIKSYNFTTATEESIKDSLARFETVIQSENITEEELERQKNLLEQRFAVSKINAMEEKYKTGLIPFKDTDDDQWFIEYVTFAKEENIVAGYKDAFGNLTGEFKPANNVTRAEILKMALEIAGHNPTTTSSLAFDHWSRFYAQKAKDLNLSFYQDVIDSPDQPATRGEVIKLILDVFGEQVPDFVLYKLSDLHSPEGRFIQYAANLDIVDGYADGTFKQDNPINRAEVSKILKNAFEILK